MAGNRGVAYMGPGKVEVQEIDYPKLELQDGPGVNPANVGRKCNHGVILKVVTTNICGSDQHMVRGRTTAPHNLVLGHEILGEVVEAGLGRRVHQGGRPLLGAVQHRLRPLPQLQGGQDRHLPERQPGPARRGLRLRRHGRLGRRPGRVRDGPVRRLEPAAVPGPGPGDGEDHRPDHAVRHLPDRLPRRGHRRRQARLDRLHRRRRTGRAGRRRRRAAARRGGGHRRPTSSQERLAQARSFGCETVDVSKGDPKDQIEQLLGVPVVDAAVDAVGFEARGHGEGAGEEAPATVLNSLMEVTAAGGAIGIPGLYVTGDPGGIDEAAKVGALSLSLGTGWAKSLSFTTGQCPVMRYNYGLMKAILHDKVQIAKAVNATVISLDEAPQGYADFDKGAAKKYVIDPHGMVAA